MNFLSFTAWIPESSPTVSADFRNRNINNTKNIGTEMAFRRNLPKAVSPVREPRDTGPEAWPPVKSK
jgi:hypothetical protein